MDLVPSGIVRHKVDLSRLAAVLKLRGRRPALVSERTAAVPLPVVDQQWNACEKALIVIISIECSCLRV